MKIKKANTVFGSIGLKKSSVFSPFQTQEAEPFQVLPFRPPFMAFDTLEGIGSESSFFSTIQMNDNRCQDLSCLYLLLK